MKKITCASSACRRNLHCFRPTRQSRLQNQAGACRACGTNPIDWQRLHRRDLHDAAYVVESLHLELIRHKFWLSVKIDSKAVDHAKRKGYDGLAMAARLRIKKSVGPASPAFDGRQTPMEGSGNVIHYAQHATASCCRK